VNVFPTNEPQDIYRAVWDALVKLIKEESIPPIRTELLDEWTRLKHGRAVAKKMIMVAQYSAGIQKQMTELYEYHDTLPDHLQFTRDELKAYRQYWVMAMDSVCSFNFVVEWFQQRVQEIYNKGAKEIKIPTPSGCMQRMFYPVYEVERVKSFHNGQLNYPRITDYKPTDEVDLSKWLSSITANTIHSLDASIMVLALHDFSESFSTIHDAIHTYGGECMDEILYRLKKAFVEVVTFDIWSEFLKANDLEETPENAPPIVGNLDVNMVLNSDYIFS
jgi:DNA-directed RNA polymerase